MIPPIQQALLLIVSAPSGAGKTTLCNRLLKTFPAMRYSISCTTRPPRGRERDGREYHFMTRAAFEAERRRGRFLEWAEVHGHYYGTSREALMDGLQAGHDMLLDIDVQGAAKIRRRLAAAPPGDALQRAYVDIFIAPPSREALEERLRHRAQDDEATMQRRLDAAGKECRHWRTYRYLVINDQLEEAFALLCAIVRAEHVRVR